ncbi:MAG: DUF983 domain-containing protein [Novosphingobium sp.]|nr:DUF983 domain-containing protein [Novosphingobium sp.]
MPDLALPIDRATLPQGLGGALWRGVRGTCPRCGGTHLFARILKPVERCAMCGQNWTLHAADDFPPYIAIILTGHIMAPVIIALGLHSALSAWAMMLIVAVLAVVLLGSLLQPAKGGVIALQWWLGLNGFAGKAGRDEAAPA